MTPLSALLHRRYYFIPHLFALVAAYFGWLVMDRTPPLRLYDGWLSPTIVAQGSEANVYWHAKYSGRDCPGTTERETIDAKNHLFRDDKRQRKGVFHPSADNPSVGTVSTPPLNIRKDMTAGRGARYRVINSYYCNWLQRKLDWPIVVQSPYIYFDVVVGKDVVDK